jgi:hypothetical protein
LHGGQGGHGGCLSGLINPKTEDEDEPQIPQIIAAKEFGIDCGKNSSETKMWIGGIQGRRASSCLFGSAELAGLA